MPSTNGSNGSTSCAFAAERQAVDPRCASAARGCCGVRPTPRHPDQRGPGCLARPWREQGSTAMVASQYPDQRATTSISLPTSTGPRRTRRPAAVWRAVRTPQLRQAVAERLPRPDRPAGRPTSPSVPRVTVWHPGRSTTRAQRWTSEVTVWRRFFLGAFIVTFLTAVAATRRVPSGGLAS